MVHFDLTTCSLTQLPALLILRNLCLQEGAEGEIIGRLNMLIFSHAPFRSFVVAVGFVLVSSEPMCAVSCACQGFLSQAVALPTLMLHPSLFLRSCQPTWSALPTTNSEMTAGKAMTAVAVWHLFYLWFFFFFLHIKFQA
jgi:hypothetical protein